MNRRLSPAQARKGVKDEIFHACHDLHDIKRRTGITDTELAVITRLSYATIQEVLLGKAGDMEALANLARIARALDCKFTINVVWEGMRARGPREM